MSLSSASLVVSDSLAFPRSILLWGSIESPGVHHLGISTLPLIFLPLILKPPLELSSIFVCLGIGDGDVESHLLCYLTTTPTNLDAIRFNHGLLQQVGDGGIVDFSTSLIEPVDLVSLHELGRKGRAEADMAFDKGASSLFDCLKVIQAAFLNSELVSQYDLSISRSVCLSV